MVYLPRLREKLETRILSRTGSHLRQLDIQLSPQGVVLNGFATTFYIKQLAQHGIRELLPNVQLHNQIVVA